MTAFNIHRAMKLVEEAVAPYPKAGLFELEQEGYVSPFEILTACIISIRARDEVMIPVARKLFSTARTPAEMCDLGIDGIDQLIASATFHTRKAEQIYGIAKKAVEEFDGTIPCDREILLSFNGVGPKCANLALGIACGQPFISVDVHVHRITNRWGYVDEKTPEKTMTALEEVLPHEYWVAINRVLVPFGKFICQAAPRCSTCPLNEMCPQIGVN